MTLDFQEELSLFSLQSRIWQLTLEMLALCSLLTSGLCCKLLAVPEILSSDMKDQTVYESLPISYEVTARGIPDPEAQWVHDGKPITAEPGRVKITQVGDKFKMEIKEVKMEDMGEMKCVVKNKEGEAVEKAKLNVIRKLIFRLEPF